MSSLLTTALFQSYRKQDAFLVTHFPLPDTVIDFWRMVTDTECHTVVVLLTAKDADSNVSVVLV